MSLALSAFVEGGAAFAAWCSAESDDPWQWCPATGMVMVVCL